MQDLVSTAQQEPSQSAFERRIEIPGLEDFIAIALQSDIPLYLEGPPGFGKSALVRKIAAKLNYPIVDIRAASLLPEDISGLPHIQQRPASALDAVPQTPERAEANANPATVKFAPPDWVLHYAAEARQASHADAQSARPANPFILFLDELNQASPSVQKALYQVVLDKTWAFQHMPQMRVIAAGNPQAMWSELDSLSPALVGAHGRLTPIQLSEEQLWPSALSYLATEYPEESRIVFGKNAIHRANHDPAFNSPTFFQGMAPRSVERGFQLYRATLGAGEATDSQEGAPDPTAQWTACAALDITMRQLLTNRGWEKLKADRVKRAQGGVKEEVKVPIDIHNLLVKNVINHEDIVDQGINWSVLAGEFLSARYDPNTGARIKGCFGEYELGLDGITRHKDDGRIFKARLSLQEYKDVINHLACLAQSLQNKEVFNDYRGNGSAEYNSIASILIPKLSERGSKPRGKQDDKLKAYIFKPWADKSAKEILDTMGVAFKSGTETLETFYRAMRGTYNCLYSKKQLSLHSLVDFCKLPPTLEKAAKILGLPAPANADETSALSNTIKEILLLSGVSDEGEYWERKNWYDCIFPSNQRTTFWSYFNR